MSGLKFVFFAAFLSVASTHPTIPEGALPINPENASPDGPQILRSKSEFGTYFNGIGMRSVDPAASCLSQYSQVLSEVQSYKPVVDAIVQAAIAGPFKGKTFEDVAEFVDTFGNRLSGTANLERAIDYTESFIKKSGATNVRSERVVVPSWKRGTEQATLILPKSKNLAIFGLGQSVNTPLFGITEDVVVFNSYAEVVANASSVKGKIAVCNFGGPAFAPLDTTNNGYSLLATNGARAALYRSAATYSLYSPHARRVSLYYDGKSPRIPVAYLTLEDADYLTRVSKRNQRIRIKLTMLNTQVDGTAISRNVFGDLEGREKNGEYILFAGHTDSWDVGQGAQDDAVGVFLPLEAIQLLKSLGLAPRRTIRVALWTGEEYGYAGSQTYIKNQANQRDIAEKLSVALEADYSCLASTGLVWDGNGQLGCILGEVLQLVGSAGTSGLLVQSPSVKSDLDLFDEIDVPVVTLLGDDGRYFWYHHTEADTMTAVNSTELDRCLALWTSTAYILADLQNKILRR